MAPMRAMSAELLEEQRKAFKALKAAAEAAAAAEAGAAATDAVAEAAAAFLDVNPLAGLLPEGEGPPSVGDGDDREGEGGDAGAPGGKGLGGVEAEKLGDGKDGKDGKDGEATAGKEEVASAGYVEFLPVEWFNKVRRAARPAAVKCLVCYLFFLLCWPRLFLVLRSFRLIVAG